jgi:enoyl-CoA hydratase/carnithine racemase
VAGAFTTVRFEKRGAIARIILNRPRHLNAYNMAMRDELDQILDAIYDDDEIAAMVISGAGRAFSSGGDLTEFGLAPSPTIARAVRFRRDVWGKLKSLPIPTVAAVHGITAGGGFEIAMLCDVAIAADNTRMWLPETGAGMIPGVCGTQTIARRAGIGRALDLCLTGRWIDAREALRLGLIVEVVPAVRLGRAATGMARAMSTGGRDLTALAKTAVWDGLDLPIDRGLQLERRCARMARRGARASK